MNCLSRPYPVTSCTSSANVLFDRNVDSGVAYLILLILYKLRRVMERIHKGTLNFLKLP